MIKYGCYQFVGEDGSCGLCKGHRYNLAIHELDIIARLFGTYPVRWKIVAFRPFEIGSPIIPYSNWHTFESNWRKVKKNIKSY